MSNLKLVYYGNPILRERSREVLNINNLLDLILPMCHIMSTYNGRGLAAPQVDRPLRFFLLQEYDDTIRYFINPVIKEFSENKEVYPEGCLSLPGVFCDIPRSSSVIVSSQNSSGEEIVWEARGILARIVQHEIDHLDGKLFIDYLEEEKRKKIENNFIKKDK